MRSPGWTLFLEGDRLVVSGGADALYLLDELPADAARTLHTAWHSDTLPSLRTPAFAPILTKLERLGALRPALPITEPLRFAIQPHGDAHAVTQAIERLVGGTDLGISLFSLEQAACAVVLRAGGTLLDAATAAAPLRVPHLLVDVAYHHTVSLGPLVWPGETACLSCLAGRIRHAWGDPEPPPAPSAAEGPRAAVCAALIVEELRRFRDTGTCTALVARTVSIDLESWTTRGERVHRLPWCPACFPESAPYGAGSFALPWARVKEAE